MKAYITPTEVVPCVYPQLYTNTPGKMLKNRHSDIINTFLPKFQK